MFAFVFVCHTKRLKEVEKEKGERKRGMKRKAVLTYDARPLGARTGGPIA